MTNNTTSQSVIPMPAGLARALTAAGGLATAASAFLAWTWTSDFPGDLTVYGYPGGLQWLTLVAGVLTLLYALAGYGLRALRWLNPGGRCAPAVILALGGFATTWFTLIAVSVELGGAVNLEPGGWIAGAAALLPVIGALGLPSAVPADADLTTKLKGCLTKPESLPPLPSLPGYAQRAILSVAVAAGLVVFTYGIDTDTGEDFTGFLITITFAAWALSTSGNLGRFSQLNAANRGYSIVLVFAAAAIFPFTQNNDHDANLGVNILIFGTVALGLNIVVGLTGLLDLGYVAFMGVGAYTAALVSGSAYSTLHDVQLPFWAAALAGAAASLVFGVLIGAPTLRLRGDYLAIVTLGFGEIFRIAVRNLDGSSGPDLTNGPNGIAAIPDLDIFGFNLGEPHNVLGFTLGRFANYYLLMLLATIIVVIVFTRAADSRLGRAWVAIREDETAATAMGINSFNVKLVAFALGATLAGLAGTVSAHVTYNVVPDPYVFAGPVAPNSAFLLAAVVLGGMGTVSGPILGAALLYLIPEKLQFLQNYELLAFGVALILIVRFRPEGIIADRRRRLEFHKADQPQAPPPADPDPDTGTGTGTALTKAGA